LISSSIEKGVHCTNPRKLSVHHEDSLLYYTAFVSVLEHFSHREVIRVEEEEWCEGYSVLSSNWHKYFICSISADRLAGQTDRQTDRPFRYPQAYNLSLPPALGFLRNPFHDFLEISLSFVRGFHHF
jgi:hypothetical protein